MATAQLGAVCRSIRHLVADQKMSGQTDGLLLRAFLDRNDQSAFEVLLRRHGAMVRGVCRRVLGNVHDAEDALQAVFLVLARQAGSIRKRESLASWLHGVAYRMAMQAKRAAARRRGHESQARVTSPRDPALNAAWHELQLLIDEEIEALSETLREPFVACCLENQSCAEAARRLGLEEDTVRKRLSRARIQLKKRLVRRGVSLTAALVALAEDAAVASVPRALVSLTVKAAANIAAGRVPLDVPLSVVTLVEGAKKAMVLTKCNAVALLLAVGFLGGAVGLGVLQGLSAQPATKVGQERRDQALPPGALFRFGTADRKRIRTASAYSPNGRIAAVGDDRGRLELWDARTGKMLRALRTKGPAVRKLAFTPNGQALVECRAENTYQFWAMPNGVEGQTLRCDNIRSKDLAFSPDGRDMLYGGFPASAATADSFRLCDPITGKVRWGKPYIFEAGAFSADGKTLLFVSGHNLVFLDAASGDQQKSVELKTSAGEHECFCHAMTLAPDGRRLALGMQTGEVYFCDPRTGGELKRFHAADRPGKDAKDRGYLTIAGVKEGFVTQVAFSPDSKWLGTCGSEGDVRLWEVATCREVLRLKGHKGWVVNLAFGSDGRTLLTSGEDGQAYLWSLRPPYKEPGQRSFETLWAALAAEPAQAYRALWELSVTDGATAFLRRKVLPARPDERLAKWIADLGNDQFALRERAQRALADQGAAALPALRQSLAAKPSLEQRRRMEVLVKLAETQPVRTEPLSAAELREERAILVLEMVGTAEARQTLQALARGAPGALRTTAAQAALKRMGQ